MTINESQEKQTLESFLEEDLPFLINSHYEDTIVIIKRTLQRHNYSFDLLLAQYPNFLNKIKYHLFFFFAHQMSSVKSNNNADYYAHYCTVSMAYRNQYIYPFVEQQIQDRTVQEIINTQQTIRI